MMALSMAKDSATRKSASPGGTKEHFEIPVIPSNGRNQEELAELERLLSLCEVQAIRSGVPFPLGATIRGDGVPIAIYRRSCVLDWRGYECIDTFSTLPFSFCSS